MIQVKIIHIVGRRREWPAFVHDNKIVVTV